MRWGQRAALTIMGSSDFLTHTPGVSPCVVLYFLSFIAFLHHSLHLIPSLSPSPSLDRSFPSLPRSLALPPGHYSVLPLYKRLLFKTLRSDLVPTEAIPLAALCIYHGSLALSRLLTLQFSCLPPSSIFFFPTRPLSHTPTHTLYLSKFLFRSSLPYFLNFISSHSSAF